MSGTSPTPSSIPCDEWEAVDRAAAEYLAERISGLHDHLANDDAGWVVRLAETMSLSEEPEEHAIEVVSAVMALQHADWLGLALGVVRRGPGAVLDPGRVQADIDRLDDVDGEIEDRQGHLAVLEMALVHLTPPWQNLGVLDEQERLTERGVWGLPKALHLERVMRHSRMPGIKNPAECVHVVPATRPVRHSLRMPPLRQSSHIV